jgi:hypothetical protein
MKIGRYTLAYHLNAVELSQRAEADAKAKGHDHLIAHYQTMAAHHAALAKRIAAREAA